MNGLLWLSPVALALAAVCMSGVFRAADHAGAFVLGTLGLVAWGAGAWRAGRRGAVLARTSLAPLSAAAAIACSAPVLASLGSRFQSVGGSATLARVVLDALGVGADVHAGTLLVGGSHALAVSANWGLVGLLPAAWVLLASGVHVLATAHGRPARALVRVAVVVAAYVVLRYALLAALALYHPDPRTETGAYPFAVDLFLRPTWQAMSFLPLVLFLARFAPWTAGEVRPRLVGARARLGLAGLLTVGAASTWTVAANYEEPGAPKAGRVLLDESHSESWSSALAALDTEHYGEPSVYNYTLLVRFLRQYFDVQVHTAGAYTSERLADVDVLVLKTATRPFAEEEVDAIEAYVRRGGGLFVIGDHTNLLGMSSNLNEVTQRFGMSFRADACNRLQDGQAHAWTPLPWDTHPIAARIRRIDFLTSCSLDVSSDAQRFLVARNVFADPADYSSHSFFGNVAPDLDEELGLLVMGAAQRVDRGRVVLFADSTVFSSFGLTYTGRSELLLGTMDWLNRANAGVAAMAGVARGISLALLVALLACAWRLPATFWSSVAPAACLVGIAAGVAASQLGNRLGHPALVARDPLPTIAFLPDGPTFELRTPLLEARGPEECAFDPLFSWPQRIGLLPEELELQDAVERDAIVVIHPDVAQGERIGASLERYVRGGGAVLVLSEDPEALGALLDPFEPGPPAESWREVPGCAAATGRAHGAGRVIVVGDPARFSRAGMGSQLDAVPEDDPRREVFAELRGLLETLRNGWRS